METGTLHQEYGQRRQKCYFEYKYKGSSHMTHTLWPNWTKIITSNANTGKISLHMDYYILL